MNTQDIRVLYTFLILLAPFGLLWLKVFMFLKKHIRTSLNYSALILFTLIGLVVYYLILFEIGNNLIDGKFGDLIGTASFATIMVCYLLIIPTTIVTVILTIIYFVSRNKNNSVDKSI